jgi:aryl-alcohol dehydrogenase-like predicted oxidoreductase
VRDVKTATVTLGSTPLTRVGLGTNRLAHTPENVAFIQDAIAAGVSLIDTAHVYASGDSEETIGAALSARPEECLIATKGGYETGTGRPEALSVQIEESLRRLRTDRIDLYYLHRPDPETPIEESLGAIKTYVDRGSIRYVGVSNVSVEEVERARQVVPIAAVQNEYNLAERAHDELVDYCEANGIVFVPYYPLHAGSRARKIAKQHGATSEQVALAWLLRRSPVTLPIPGTLSLEHLKDNLAATQIELTADEFEALS